MINGGEAADQMVNYATKTGEVLVRLAGAGAKNLAVYLAAILKDNKKNKGKTFLSRMLSEGKELKVFSIRQVDLKQFTLEARKYGVLFASLRDKKDQSGMCDIMAKAEDAAKLNRIMERMGFADIKEATTVTQEIIEERGAPNEKGNLVHRNQMKTQVENPTRGRTKQNPQMSESPSGSFSGDRTDSIPAERVSVRNRLDRIKGQLNDQPKQNQKQRSMGKSQRGKRPPNLNRAR